jgi:tRNA(fMet)-specific endonuclease VapC
MLDTSVLLDLGSIDSSDLPIEASIAALTLAELTCGPLALVTAAERAERLERLLWAESKFEAIPFDVAAAHAYGRVHSAAVADPRHKARAMRAIDLLVAATALSRGLPLYTRNPADFSSVAGLVEIVAVDIFQRQEV